MKGRGHKGILNFCLKSTTFLLVSQKEILNMLPWKTQLSSTLQRISFWDIFSSLLLVLLSCNWIEFIAQPILPRQLLIWEPRRCITVIHRQNDSSMMHAKAASSEFHYSTETVTATGLYSRARQKETLNYKEKEKKMRILPKIYFNEFL